VIGEADAARAARAPTAVVIGDAFPGRRRYRLVGGDLAPAWADRVPPGTEAWCEITVWDAEDGAPGSFVGSFGGEVWPSAWPHLFTGHKGNAQSGAYTTITTDGLRLLAASLRAVAS
jgi:hypothetical protein